MRINRSKTTNKILSWITTITLIVQVVLPGGLFNFGMNKVEAAVTVTVTTPTGATDWDIGDTENIVWTMNRDIPDADPDYYKLYYSVNSGSDYTLIDDNVPFVPGPSQSYPWEIPVVSGAGTKVFMVKVEAYYTSTGYITEDESVLFAIDYGALASVSIDYHSTMSLWTNFALTVTAKDQYDNTIVNYNTEINLNSSGATITPWTIGNGSTTGTWSNGTVTHDGYQFGPGSAGPTTLVFTPPGDAFPIVLENNGVYFDTPVAATSWQEGTSQNVIFRAGGTTSIDHLAVYYSDDNGSSWTLDNGSVSPGAMPQTYSWDIPLDMDNIGLQQFQIQIKSYDSGSSLIATGTSAAFTITDASNTVTISSPTTGDQWVRGASGSIIFAYSGDTTVDHFDIKISDDSGSTWRAVTSGLAASGTPQTYTWSPIFTDMNNYNSVTFQIKVESYNAADNIITSGSSALFQITSSGGGPVVEPADISSPISRVIGVLDSSGNLVTPMPATILTSTFTVVAEASDLGLPSYGLKSTELYWSQTANGTYQNYGFGSKTTIAGTEYWVWNFTGVNSRYYFYSVATDNWNNTEVLPKPFWTRTIKYDATTRISARAPIIRSTLPVDGQVSVANNTTVRVVFDYYMDTASVESAFSIRKTSGGGPDLIWNAVWTSSNRTVTFSLASGQTLDYNTNYTAFVDPAIAKSQYGEPLNPVGLVVNPWGFKTAIEQFPDLTTSTKIANKDVCSAGDSIIYTITLINTGDINANVTFSDAIPLNTTYNNYISGATYDALNNKIVWSGVLQPTRSRTIRFRVLVDKPLPNDTQIINEAKFDDGKNPTISKFAVTTVSSPEADITSTSPIHNAENIPIGTTVRIIFSQPMDKASVENAFKVLPGTNAWTAVWTNLNRTVTFSLATGQTLDYLTKYIATIDPAIARTDRGATLLEITTAVNPWTFTTAKKQVPDLTVSTKISNADTAQPGALLTYTVNLVNSGTATANVTLLDPIPADTTYANYVRNASYDSTANAIVWSGTLLANRTRVVTFRVRVNSPLPNGTVVTNAAEINDGVNPTLIKYAETLIESPEAQIVTTSPLDGEINVGTKPTIRVTFDQPMDRANTQAAFSLMKVGGLPGNQGPGWNSGWDYRSPLTIDHTKITGDLANFPVLISMTNPNFRSTANGGKVAKANGSDITFTTDDGTTKLSHEIESYNPTTGEVIAWVKISNLSASIDTGIYMYYGNTNASDQWDTVNVWDGNFKMVQHLEEACASANCVADSTANKSNGTAYAGSNIVNLNTASGKIGMAGNFNGSNNVIDYGANPNLTQPNMTVEAWVKANAFVSWNGIYSNLASWGTGFGLQAGNVQRIAGTISGAYLNSATKPNTNTWYHIVTTHNAATNENIIYINGIRENAFIRPVTYAPNAKSMTGVFYTSRSLPWNGIIDEVRVSNTARSAQWIMASFSNQDNPGSFVSLGTEEMTPDKGGEQWKTVWSNGDRTVAFSLLSGQLDYVSIYSANIDATIATTRKGAPLSEYGLVPNPWSFSTAEMQKPNMTNSNKPVNLDTAQPGALLTYTVNLVNSGTATANVTLLDPIPADTTYANYVRNASYDSTANAIVWSGTLLANRTRVVTFRVRVNSPLPNGTVVTNAAEINDGVNPTLIKYAETLIESPEAQIVTTSPLDGEINVGTKPTIRVTFSEPMDRANTQAAFSLMKVGGLPGNQGPGWNSGWDYRSPLNIDHTKVTSDLANFPVLISMTNPNFRSIANGGKVAKANGSDITFTTDDGTTKLSHEIESYNPVTGEVIAWVKISNLSASIDTGIYMYYGNTNAGDQWDIANVWDSNFKMVQHLEEACASANCVADSTANGSNGTAYAGSNIVNLNTASGKIGSGANFNGSNNVIDYGINPNLTQPNMTVEAWVRANAFVSWNGIYSNLPSWGTGFGLQAGNVQRIAGTISGRYLNSATRPTTNTWYHIVTTHNAATNENIIYVNGIRENAFVRPVTYAPNARSMTGVFYTSRSLPWNGIIDEVRVSNTPRSAEWIMASFSNQDNPGSFVSLGTEEMTPDKGGNAWNIAWANGDRRMTLTLPTGQALEYSAQYKAFVDPTIATTRKGAPLNPTNPTANPWAFNTAEFGLPILTNSAKMVDLAIANPGNVLLYTVTLRNTSDFDATVSIEDYIPNNTTYNYYATGGLRFDNATNRMYWSGTLLAHRNRTMRFQVKIDDVMPNGSSILNEVKINDGVHPIFSKFAETYIESGTNFDNSYKATTNDIPDREPGMAQPGDTLTNTIYVENSGSMDAYDTFVTDLIPTNTSFVEDSATGGLTYNTNTRTLQWSGMIPAKLSNIFTFKVTVDEDKGLFRIPNDKVLNEAVISDLTDSFSVKSATTIVIDEDGGGGGNTNNPPYLLEVKPVDGTKNVKLYDPLVLKFSEDVNSNSLRYIVSNDWGTDPIDTTNWTIDEDIDATLTLRPNKPLASGSTYIIQVVDVIDTDGQSLGTDGPIPDNTFSFSTVRPTLYFVDKQILKFTAGTISNAIEVKLGNWINYDDENATKLYDPYTVEDPTGLVVRLWGTSATGKFDTSPSGTFAKSILDITMPMGSDSFTIYYTDNEVNAPLTYKIVAYPPYIYPLYLVYSDERLAQTNDGVGGGGSDQNRIEFLTESQSVPMNFLSNQIAFEIRSPEGKIVELEAGKSFLLGSTSNTGRFYNSYKLPLDYTTIIENHDYYRMTVPEDSTKATFYYKDSNPGLYTIRVKDEGISIAAGDGPALDGTQSINIVPIKDQDIPTDKKILPVNDDSGRELGYIVVEPVDTVLLPGATQSFIARGFDTDGQEITSLQFGWYAIAGGGSITQPITGSNTATFLAGGTPGVYYDTVMAAALYNDTLLGGYATVRVARVLDYGWGSLPSSGPNGIQIIFIILMLLSAVALAEVEHYEKTHFPAKKPKFIK